MKKFLAFSIFFFSLYALKAQDTDFHFKTLPKFNGDLNKYVLDHINASGISLDSGAVKTRSVVRFTVENDGSISSVKIIYPSIPALDSAVVKCIREMPKWQPGMQNGKPVGSTYQMPINVDWR